MILNLSKYTVTLKDELTWYDQEEIKATMITGSRLSTDNNEISVNGNGLFEAKIKTIECAVTEIKEGDKNISFSRDWLKSLSQEDGSKLDSALSQYSQKKV